MQTNLSDRKQIDPDTLVNWDFVEQVVSSLVKLISS